MKPGNEAGSLEFGLLRSAPLPMKHAQISPELRRLHIDDARKNLLPGREWALIFHSLFWSTAAGLLFFIFAEPIASIFIHGEDELIPQAAFAIR